MNRLYNIYIDDRKFVMTKGTINRFPNFLLKQVIDGIKNDSAIIINSNDIYIDRDPVVFSYIIDKVRGYDIDLEKIQDQNLLTKIKFDLIFFGLENNNVTNIDPVQHNNFIPDIEKELSNGNTFDVINSLSNNPNIKNMIGGLLKQLNEKDRESDQEVIDLDFTTLEDNPMTLDKDDDKDDDIDESSELITDVFNQVGQNEKIVSKLFKL